MGSTNSRSPSVRRLFRTLIVAAILALLLPAGSLNATPTIPVIIVNHETRQCSRVIQGDDCSWCDPPPGWEIVGQVDGTECPEGYAQVDRPAMQCRLYKTPFCCSSGVHRGDCEDMVVNEAEATCGFVAEIEGCPLPAGWLSRPADLEPTYWSCPQEYRWATEEIACLAGDATPNSTAPAGPEEEGSPWRVIFLSTACLIFAAVLFGAAGLFPAWYARRQQQRRMEPPSRGS
ncbi:MAG TPA: hypothetical protein VLC52_07385 [Anaerolineae bacterium]|nr:hypothetical protein [Anaerolineae bacterium]